MQKVSLADLIVLAGCAAVGKRRKRRTFYSGSFYTGQNRCYRTNRHCFLRRAWAQCWWFPQLSKSKHKISAEEMLVDKPNCSHSPLRKWQFFLAECVCWIRILISPFMACWQNPETLSNDFFVNLLDFGTTWKALSDDKASLWRKRPEKRSSEMDSYPSRSDIRIKCWTSRNRGSVYAFGRRKG